MFTASPIPHEEGRKLIAGKPALVRAVFDALLPDLQARAFVITGVECVATVGRVRDMISRIPMGEDWAKTKKAVLAEISPWLITAADPEERAKQATLARIRAEMLLRLHAWQGYSQSNFALMETHKDVFPWRKYIARADGRERPSHKALHNKIIPAADPFWQTHTPPWEFGCRCQCVALTQKAVERIMQAEAHLPPEARQVLGPEMLQELRAGNLIDPQGGRIDIRTPREAQGPGHYEWRPGDTRLPMRDILARYPAPERAAFEGFAERQMLDDGRSLLQWLEGEPASLKS